MSEINDIEELPEGIFPINEKLNQKYQRTEPSIQKNMKMVRTIKNYFVEVVIFILTYNV